MTEGSEQAVGGQQVEQPLPAEATARTDQAAQTKHLRPPEPAEQPEPSPEAEQAEIRVRIAADRENLGQTIEALAAKTHVSARAKDAARDTAVATGRRLTAVPAHVLSGAATVWQRGMSVTRPVRQRLAAIGTGAVDRVRAAGRPR